MHLVTKTALRPSLSLSYAEIYNTLNLNSHVFEAIEQISADQRYILWSNMLSDI